jgi:hypothetical protein
MFAQNIDVHVRGTYRAGVIPTCPAELVYLRTRCQPHNLFLIISQLRSLKLQG